MTKDLAGHVGHTPRDAGFTLIEIMIVVAILAIIAAVAVPNLFSARASANEASAIATLRSIFTGQAQFQGTAVMDSDGDGNGEFGFFGELSGGLPLNVRGSGVPRRLEPPFVDTAFTAVRPLGFVEKSGYAFQIWLPDSAGAGVGETPGAVSPALDADEGERYWICYAWPMVPGNSGVRAFVINQSGELHFTDMQARAYSAVLPPRWDAAYRQGATEMGEPLASGAVGLDTNTWRVLR